MNHQPTNQPSSQPINQLANQHYKLEETSKLEEDRDSQKLSSSAR